MKLNNLQDLFLDELKDMYSGETQILKALPKMARQATSEDLKDALEEHLEQTRGHKERLEQIFEGLGQKAKAKLCKGLQGIIEEGDDMLKEDAEDSVLDAAIIAAGQRVEHYEMAAYGTLRTYAQVLGLDDAARLLQLTLDEEKAADQKLNEIAETHVNEMAVSGTSDEDEEAADDGEVGSGRRGVTGMRSDEDDEDVEIDETQMAGNEEEVEAEDSSLARGQNRGTQAPRGNPGAKPTRRSNKKRENA